MTGNDDVCARGFLMPGSGPEAEEHLRRELRERVVRLVVDRLRDGRRVTLALRETKTTAAGPVTRDAIQWPDYAFIEVRAEVGTVTVRAFEYRAGYKAVATPAVARAAAEELRYRLRRAARRAWRRLWALDGRD